MAKYTGIIKLKGTIGGINFYGDGFCRIAGGGFTSELVKKSPSHLATRQYGTEFGNSARVKRLVRMSVEKSLLAPLGMDWHGQLKSLMGSIKDHDLINRRGERVVSVGFQTEAARSLMRSHLFSPAQTVYPLFEGLPVAQTAGASCSFGDLKLLKKSFKSGATHLRLRYFVVDYDMELLTVTTFAADEVLLSKAALPGCLPDFVIADLPEIPSFRLAFLSVQFCVVNEGVVVAIKEVEMVGLRCVGVFVGG